MLPYAQVNTEPAHPRVIVHVDLDYFFAQCEERERPDLKDKPVVVCVFSGRTADSGAVSTANYLARKLGVKSGIPIAFAKRMLKEHNASFLPVNHELYRSISDRIMGILRNHADRIQQAGIDEAYLDITERTGTDYSRATQIGKEIKTQILEHEKLTCSVGIGQNKIVAKMAADVGKPDALTVVKPEETKSFLSPMHVEKLFGVGKKTVVRMDELGIKTVEDLANYNSDKLVSIFGKALGTYFHNAANGIDDEPVEEREGREQISKITTLKENSRDLELIFPEIDRLSEQVHTKLSGDLNYYSVGVIAVMEDLTMHSKSKTLEAPSQNLETLKNNSKELFKQLLSENASLSVRRVGVRISSLERAAPQKSLGEFLSERTADHE
ncbi:MAG: DNA polymerase IV [Candidatus Bathyarchaeia archaeon]